MTKGFPRGALRALLLRALLLRGLLLCGALAPLPLAAEAPSGSWMRLDDALIELADARCGEIFDGQEYIMQSNGDEFLKLRFEHIPESAGDFDFSQPRHVSVSRRQEGEAFYLLDRSMPLESQGDTSGASGSAFLYPENDAARERHPDGAELAFALRCAAD